MTLAYFKLTLNKQTNKKLSSIPTKPKEVYRMLNRLEKKGQFPQHLITQTLNIQGEKRIFKVARGKGK